MTRRTPGSTPTADSVGRPGRPSRPIALELQDYVGGLRHPPQSTRNAPPSLSAMNTDEDILATAARWRDEGHRVALATVIRTWGSAPRRAGSHMVINETGAFSGSVSGGCVESAVAQEIAASMESGAPKLISFGVTDEDAWEVGLACGGTIGVFVQPAEIATLLCSHKGVARDLWFVREAGALDSAGGDDAFPNGL